MQETNILISYSTLIVVEQPHFPGFYGKCPMNNLKEYKCKWWRGEKKKRKKKKLQVNKNWKVKFI